MSSPIFKVADLFKNGAANTGDAHSIRSAVLNIPWTDSLDLIQVKIQALHLLLLTDVILPKLEALEQNLQSA